MTELTALEKIEKLGKSVAKMTQADLARAVGCSRERIRQLVPRLKVKPGRRAGAWHHTLARKECEAMAKLYEAGNSLADIGRQHGVSDYHVREAIRQVRKSLVPAKKPSRKH
jgi:biotin operon repressor